MAVVVELSGTNTLSDRLLCSRWVEPRASPLMVPYLLLFWQYFNSEQMLTQPRVSSVSVRVTRLYTFKVCATQYFLMRATLLAVCMWCELNTVRLLGLEVWVGTRHDWLLSEVYQTFIISNLQPTTYFFPQSPVWRIAVPIFPFYFYWQRQKCWSEAKRTVISTQDDGGDQIRAKKLKMHIGLFARLPEKDYISR